MATLDGELMAFFLLLAPLWMVVCAVAIGKAETTLAQSIPQQSLVYQSLFCIHSLLKLEGRTQEMKERTTANTNNHFRRNDSS